MKAVFTLRTCGNCKHLRILKITPFIKGWWVGDGRCRKTKLYKSIGDSCKYFKKKGGEKK